MSNNKAISAVTPETFINNSVESLNNVQSNILSNMNNNKVGSIGNQVTKTGNGSNDMFYYFIIIILLLAILGVNIFVLMGNVTDDTIRNSGPFMRFIYSLFGYPVGEIIKTGSDVAGKGAKTGIDITTGTISSTVDTVNELIQPDDVYNIKKDVVLNSNNISNLNENPRSKTKYCYVGASNGANTCATITNSDKCLSGHIFNDLKTCMNK